MPRYDYRCAVCGHEVELLRGIHDSGPQVCPNCGAEGSMRKAFATPAVHYKGSGWAKKDRSSSRPAASSSIRDGSKDGSSTSQREGSGKGSNGERDGGGEGGDRGTDRGGDGAAVTTTGDSATSADVTKPGTVRDSAPKPTSDRGAA